MKISPRWASPELDPTRALRHNPHHPAPWGKRGKSHVSKGGSGSEANAPANQADRPSQFQDPRMVLGSSGGSRTRFARLHQPLVTGSSVTGAHPLGSGTDHPQRV